MNEVISLNAGRWNWIEMNIHLLYDDVCAISAHRIVYTYIVCIFFRVHWIRIMHIMHQDCVALAVPQYGRQKWIWFKYMRSDFLPRLGCNLHMQYRVRHIQLDFKWHLPCEKLIVGGKALTRSSEAIRSPTRKAEYDALVVANWNLKRFFFNYYLKIIV